MTDRRDNPRGQRVRWRLSKKDPGMPGEIFGSVPYLGQGKLAQVLRAAKAATGLNLPDLTVLKEDRDPYRLDTSANHALGRWFAAHFNRLVGDGGRDHLRGFHYRLISTSGIVKPDGEPYRNTLEDYEWMNDKAAKAARWLGYVGFDRFTDKRNAAPVIHRQGTSFTSQAPPTTGVRGLIDMEWPYRHSIFCNVLGDDVVFEAPSIEPGLDWFPPDDQPYCFAFFGEKSSLEKALDPVARRYGANMYLCAGEISDTLVYEMARDGAKDDRPLIVFTFSDFDPSGYQMPVSIARKLQALRDLLFPTLTGQVVPVSLTLEQVLAFRLPTTPVKAGDKRRDRWDDAFGPALRAAGIATGIEPAQVEIDALAALRSDDLRRIAREAIAPYRDDTLNSRSYAAASEWRRAANAAVAAQVDADELAVIKEEAEEAVEELNAVLATLRQELATLRQEQEQTLLRAQQQAGERMRLAGERFERLRAAVELPDPPPLPELRIDHDRQKPLIDIEWSFEDATQALKARKTYGNDDD
jgi:hypothetical protein